MPEATSFESWVDTSSIGEEQIGSTWDQVQLGQIFLPGVVTIEDFEYGQDIDVQKRRKKEKPRIRDNGLAPCAFDIKVELRAADWPRWQQALAVIQPRKEGAVRTPMPIVHPLPNAHGVKDIYIHKIRYGSPSARRGLVVTIRVAEWFEEEKDTKGAKKGTVVPGYPGTGYERPDYFGDPKKLAKTLNSNQGNLPAESYEDVMARSFSE